MTSYSKNHVGAMGHNPAGRYGCVDTGLYPFNGSNRLANPDKFCAAPKSLEKAGKPLRDYAEGCAQWAVVTVAEVRRKWCP